MIEGHACSFGNIHKHVYAYTTLSSLVCTSYCTSYNQELGALWRAKTGQDRSRTLHACVYTEHQKVGECP